MKDVIKLSVVTIKKFNIISITTDLGDVFSIDCFVKSYNKLFNKTMSVESLQCILNSKEIEFDIRDNILLFPKKSMAKKAIRAILHNK